jgi:hypothetical protein
VSQADAQLDLIVLAACKNSEAAIQGILSRHQSLNIRRVEVDIRVHPDSDPGCRGEAHSFLRPFCNQYQHALVVFDREGCGRDAQSREQLEQGIEKRLATNGWQGRAATVVFDPELESWVWSDSREVDTCLGWQSRQPSLREWLVAEGFLVADQIKPNRPKEAVEAALRIARKNRSSRIYKQLASQVSLKRCTDPAFLKLKTILQTWFPQTLNR